jgi:hypothetical protein
LSYEELHADLSELQSRLKGKEPKRNIIFLPLFRYAAGIILLLGVGTIVYMLNKSVEKSTQIAESLKPVDTIIRKNQIAVFPDTNKKAIIAQQLSTAKKEKLESKDSYTPVVVDELNEAPASRYESKEIEEVEVIGYGELQEPEMAGAIGTIQVDSDITIEQALQGKAAGIKTTTKNGETGPESKVKIRGLASEQTNTMTISGTVVSASDGSTLPGVNVVVEGTATGTITDIDGNFAIEVPSKDETTLQFSYLGYVTEELKIPEEESITVEMTEDIVALDEVVVIGYGVQKQSALTGATVNVPMDESSATTPVIVYPKPVGGIKDFKEYIKKNIHYNQLPAFEKTETVKLKFTVNTQGELSNFAIIDSAGTQFDAEAIRIIQEGPKWTPAARDNRPISDEVILKIRFEPQEK